MVRFSKYSQPLQGMVLTIIMFFFVPECRKKLEAEKQLLLDEAEKVRQYRLQLQQEQQAILEESRRKFQEQFERER